MQPEISGWIWEVEPQKMMEWWGDSFEVGSGKETTRNPNSMQFYLYICLFSFCFTIYLYLILFDDLIFYLKKISYQTGMIHLTRWCHRGAWSNDTTMGAQSVGFAGWRVGSSTFGWYKRLMPSHVFLFWPLKKSWRLSNLCHPFYYSPLRKK